MAANLRVGLRARALAGVLAAAAASPLGLGGVTTGHAATAWLCETPASWVTNNSITPGTLSGQTMFVGIATCAVGTTSPIAVGVGSQSTYSAAYTYSGTCAEGTLSFSNGTIGIFVGGILVAEQQSSAGVGVLVAVGTPLGIPCTGGTIIWAAPVGVEAGA